jgi:hypothetical protein
MEDWAARNPTFGNLATSALKITSANPLNGAN